MIGSLYFMQEGADGAIKIGFTTADPANRVKSMQIGNSAELRLIAVLKNYPDSEKVWHRRFADHRIRNEWFEPAAPLLAAIAEAAENHSVPKRSNVVAKPQTREELRAWLKINKISQAAFARSLGYSTSYINVTLNDMWSFLSPRLANRIEEVTCGHFTAIALLAGKKIRSWSDDRALRQAGVA